MLKNMLRRVRGQFVPLAPQFSSSLPAVHTNSFIPMRPNIEFLERPIRLRTHLRPVVVPDSAAVVLVCEQENYILDGAIYGRLIPLLDGSINATEISCRLADEFSKFQVIEAVVALHEQGHLALGSMNASVLKAGLGL